MNRTTPPHPLLASQILQAEAQSQGRSEAESAASLYLEVTARDLAAEGDELPAWTGNAAGLTKPTQTKLV